ncbi:MAG: DUF2809 domain-containing protein [Ruminococcus sp.]|nr:DUF2809 domain-containing protein [Ruminococcus sp.]
MKQRLSYGAIFLALLGIEVLIALFIHGGFIRSYMGDVIVVWVVYCFVQLLLGGKNDHVKVAAGVLIFAYLVEVLQGIHIVDLLGLGGIRFFRVLIGTSFSWIDMICYTAGAALNIMGILLVRRAKKGRAQDRAR